MGGGLTKGPSHAKGGIKMKVKSTGQQIEVEGGEGIINKHVMSSKKKISYRGKKATPCEIASDLNQQTGNGVKFDCDETKNTDMTPTDPSTGFDKGGLLLAGILGYSLLSKDSSEAKTLEAKQSDKVDSKFQDFISDVDNEGLDKILDGDYKDYDSITDKKFNKLFKNLQSSKKDLEKEVASIKDEDYKDEIEGFVDSEGFDYYFAQYMEGEKFKGKDLQDKVKKYQEDRDALVIYVDEDEEYSLAKGGKVQIPKLPTKSEVDSLFSDETQRKRDEKGNESVRTQVLKDIEERIKDYSPYYLSTRKRDIIKYVKGEFVIQYINEDGEEELWSRGATFGAKENKWSELRKKFKELYQQGLEVIWVDQVVYVYISQDFETLWYADNREEYSIRLWNNPKFIEQPIVEEIKELDIYSELDALAPIFYIEVIKDRETYRQGESDVEVIEDKLTYSQAKDLKSKIKSENPNWVVFIDTNESFSKGGAIESTIKTQTNPKHLEIDAIEEVAEESLFNKGGETNTQVPITKVILTDFDKKTYFGQYKRVFKAFESGMEFPEWSDVYEIESSGKRDKDGNYILLVSEHPDWEVKEKLNKIKGITWEEIYIDKSLLDENFAKGGKLSKKVKSLKKEFVGINNKLRGVKSDLEKASYKDDKAYNLSRKAADTVYTGTKYQDKLNNLEDDMIGEGYAKGGQLEYVEFEDGTYYQYPRKRAMNILNRPLSDNELDELRYANSLIKYANDLTYSINNDNRYDLIAERDMQLQQANAMIEKLLDAEYQFAKGGLAKGGNPDTYIFDSTKWSSRDTRVRNEILSLLNKPSVNEEGSIINTQTYVSRPYVPNVWTYYNASNRTIWLNQKIIGRPSVLKGDYSIDTFVDIQLSKSNIYKVKPKAIQIDKLPMVIAEEGERFFFPAVLDNIGVRKKGYIDESKDGYLIDKFLEENPQPTKPEEIFIPQSPTWDLQNRAVKFNVFKKIPNIKDLIVVPPSNAKGVQIGSYVDQSSGYDYVWYAKSIEYVASNIASPLIIFKGDYGSYYTIDAFTGGVGGPPSYPLKPSSRRKLSDAKESVGESLWSMIILNLCSEQDIKDEVFSAISMATPLDKRESVMKWFVENYWPDYSPDAVITEYGTPNQGRFRKDVYEEKGLVQKYLSPSELNYESKFYSYGNWNMFEPFYANSLASNEIMKEIEDYKLASEGKIIDIEYLDYRPTFKTRFFEGIPGSEIIANWEDWELKIPKETWLQIDALINDRLKDKKFLDRCVEFYNDRVIESVNETNLNGFLSPSYYIDMTEPEKVVKLSKNEKNINLFNTHPNKQEITRIQTLMSILDFDYQAKKQLNEEIRSLEDDMEVELNLDGKPHYNLKNAFKNFFKTADKKYVGKIGKQTEALAPDGEQSKLTTKQFDLVRTRQFMTWFGDWQQAFETKNYEGVSKCISEDGEPKIVYHGTVSPFEWTKFSLGEDSSWTKDAPPVVYFAESKDYSNWFGSSKKTGKAGDDYVYEFFLNCRNPINLIDFGYSDLNIFDLEFLLKEKHGIEIDTTEIVARVPNIQAVKYPFWVFLRNYKRFGLGNMFDKFIALGYDSIQFVENNPSSIIDGKSEVTVAWVIFDKNQAKLGDGRNTTFSQFSDDFRFKKGGNVNR